MYADNTCAGLFRSGRRQTLRVPCGSASRGGAAPGWEEGGEGARYAQYAYQQLHQRHRRQLGRKLHRFSHPAFAVISAPLGALPFSVNVELLLVALDDQVVLTGGILEPDLDVPGCFCAELDEGVEVHGTPGADTVRERLQVGHPGHQRIQAGPLHVLELDLTLRRLKRLVLPFLRYASFEGRPYVDGRVDCVEVTGVSPPKEKLLHDAPTREEVRAEVVPRMEERDERLARIELGYRVAGGTCINAVIRVKRRVLTQPPSEQARPTACAGPLDDAKEAALDPPSRMLMDFERLDRVRVDLHAHGRALACRHGQLGHVPQKQKAHLRGVARELLAQRDEAAVLLHEHFE
ncbi:hypothetical protein FB451DRAFT_1188411 [Mycena latifolia]|nr:hypothetical protein FB451DRAFT_1188411 [Mycena latifolia]